MPLSVFIIAHNEVDRIGATIRGGAGPDRRSRGGRFGLHRRHAGAGGRARRAGDSQSLAGYGPQKRFAEEQCRHVWLLNLDADEVVPEDLVREIRALWAAGEPRRPAWRIGIAEIFPGEGRPHPLAYTLTPVRLYRKDRGRYAASPVHDRVALEPASRRGGSGA